jgi:K+-transporting ATPase ATPase B chain
MKTKKIKNKKLMDVDLMKQAFRHSFIKLDPRVMIKNPVMFTVEIGTAVMLAVILDILFTQTTKQGSLSYNIFIFESCS